MIDVPLAVERLLVRMKASLPLRAEATPALAEALRRQASAAGLSRKALIDMVDYAGDEVAYHVSRPFRWC
jgi:hypothetical protein